MARAQESRQMADAGTHTEHEDDPWTIVIPDHPRRTDSPAFVAARAFAHRIMATLGPGFPYGPGPWQMHHGGSLWTYDDGGWFLVLNTLGSEWSAQWCADPAKMDLARLNAARHYAGFPRSIPQMTAMGYPAGEEILNTRITDPRTLGVYVDSIFNSCVPLAGIVHTGVVSAAAPYGGVHHYPKPITDIQFLKRDDFTLWVTDGDGQPAAVTPLAPRGSGDGRVQVVYTTPNTSLDRRHGEADAAGDQLILGSDHPLALQAFRLQRPGGA
jgi:hypothetical protein